MSADTVTNVPFRKAREIAKCRQGRSQSGIEIAAPLRKLGRLSGPHRIVTRLSSFFLSIGEIIKPLNRLNEYSAA